MMRETIEYIELDMKDLEALLQRVKAGLGDKDHELLQKLVGSYTYLTHLVEDDRTTIAQLRRLLGKGKTEKTKDVVGGTDGAQKAGASKGGQKKKKGHGRRGAKDYPGAEKVTVAHESLKPGDACPNERCRGKVYKQREPSTLVRFTGQAPLPASVYELERYRCNLCGEVFTAKAPDGVGAKKYDAKSAAMIGLLKYGSGLPFNRLAGLQGGFGLPLPASTQWDIVAEAAGVIDPAYRELIRQAAQGDVVHNDDTSMRILELMGTSREEAVAEASASDGVPPDRNGIFTSGIVSTCEGRRMALFFTGRKHAGENLETLLNERASERSTPIQMCDALSRNLPGDLEVIVANCIAHGRRQFVDVAGSFPDECRHVLEELAKVYENDAAAKAQRLSPQERLRFHQDQSGPVMDALEAWLTAQFAERKVEPNSRLGKAIQYMQNHWEKFTLFLRVAGAPLDNNVCERALKKAILHRKNALFFKTRNGARVGDIFMSLIYTCQLSRTNPFEYLTALLEHPAAVADRPKDWMPWNFQDAVGAAAASHGA